MNPAAGIDHRFISAAIADPEADLDKDGQTSLLEAHLTAAKRTADFYQLEQRMATEHPLLDDNGNVVGAFEFVTDQTAIKQMMRRSQKVSAYQVESANAIKDVLQ